MRPADVEGWLVELGLAPTDRADRDGIASWDLVLDGRRRFDLRMTVILDPALAIICWAQYAPPISDMFRKSYRKLLRWNDEFPFAKFSVAEDERPLLAVELPIADGLGRLRWVSPSRASSASPTACSTNRATGCGTGARCPIRVTGRRATGRSSIATRRACRSSWSRDPKVRRAPAGLHRRGRPAGQLRWARRQVRAAAPDLTIVTDARYDVQPAQHRVHVTLDMVLTNHLHDTSTKRFYFDRAFISVLPATSGFKLTWSGSGTPKATVSKKTATYTVVQLDLAAKLYSGKSASYRLAFDLVDPGGDASRDVRIGTSLASFPVWAFATDSTPGSTVTVAFPAGYQVEVESGDIPAPTTGTDGVIDLPDRQARRHR